MCELCNTKTEFVNLHNHPSSKDTFGTIDTFTERAKELGQFALAKTDHGGCHGHDIEFKKSCDANGIKSIFGNEVYITIDKEYAEVIFKQFDIQINTEKKYHLTLLAKSQIGYDNLININNIAKENRTNSIQFKDIYANKEDIIILTGCISSPFQQLDLQVAEWLLSCVSYEMGEENVYIEVHVINNILHTMRAFDLLASSNLKHVTTNDAHFADKGDGEFHKKFCEQTLHFSFDSNELFLATAEDILKRCHEYDFSEGIVHFVYDGILEAVRLANDIEQVVFKQREPYLPPQNDAKKELRKLVVLALKEYKKELPKKEYMRYLRRVREELDVISSMDYDGYFLILYDVVKYALENNIAVGNGRGSAVGSLVVYLLGLTKIDPIKNDLLFARFLSKERVSMPDIDIDFGSSDRPKVIEYFQEKYNAVQVAAYDTFSTKSILAYFSKSFKLNYALTKQARDLEVEPDDNQYLQKLFQQSPDFEMFFKKIYKQIKGLSTHAGGVVILPPDTSDFLSPLELDKNGNTLIAYSEGINRSDLSFMGLVKFDILSIKSIESIAICERLSGELRPDFDKIPDEVYEKIFSQGMTSSIFQFNSVGVRNYLKEIKPTKFEDIVDVNALWRASTMEAGTTKAYAKSRKSGKFHHYRDKTIDKILAQTFGHIVYQEQFMQLYAYATDKTFAQADIARRAIVKAKEEQIANIKTEFFDGMRNKGVEENVISSIWDEIYSQRKYSFNRAHAVAYATTALHMAYYKWKYPVIFAASALNTRPSKEWMEIILELMLEDIEIVPPSINYSTIDFTVENGKLYAPLSIIRGFGNATVEHILQERVNGNFKNVEDLIERTERRRVNKTNIKIIVELGLLEYNDIDEVYKLLKIKKEEDKFNLNPDYKHIKQYFTDVLIPPKGAITTIKNNLTLGNRIGYVVFHDKKKSKRDYQQYNLAPNSILRVTKDGHDELNNLDLVMVDSMYKNHFIISDNAIKKNTKY